MIDKKHLDYLTSIVGEENIKSDKAHLIAFCYDATRSRFEPDAVVFPRHEQDVSDILKYCNEHKIVIVPRGAGSGFTGGALPANGGIILSLERHMNKLLEIDMENMVGVVQPGLINMQFQKAVEEVGLFYPPDPASEEYSSLGGNVSENAGGMRAAKYGITKDYVIALRAVLPNGDIIVAGKKTIKDVAGYNTAGILIASEGTLAVITEITLKLIPKPKFKKTYMGVFPSVDSAMTAVFKSLAAGANPVAMEFLDALVIKALKQKFPHISLPENAGGILVGDVDASSEDEINSQLETLKNSFAQNGSIDFIVASDEEESKKLWFARRNASPATMIYGTKKLNEDISVPRSKLPVALEGIYKIGEKYGFNVPCFGHAGDGNIHVNVMVKDKTNEKEMEDGHKAIEEIFQYVVDLGGTLSGEHGIGLSKAPFMNIAFTEAEMNLFRNIKKAFDPNNILNPFKMGL
ncbi:FAD-binding protein [Aliarcobacter butzleri]|uniref:FAD-binding oxidoreductase n=1 Tax=Aliarcobacter butzleri TaxID=28197 RepID=UPI0006598BE0|nr:FAD-linked oxidase C-terminal domain-containing protein [Aliarcobacter butzleri]KLE05802.1 FAD-binding protein [Aliarcobacter butzleri L353]MCT7566759.1 FAD-binding protein [Aliarcobacter butzleri]MCT7570913.1 FAD-binding protein [Aliarcobacter butzleri]MCT7597323.1 FAD-binding protein [Aliarcobacter butzleri]MCT7626448.1 FAD-binding protein [Aliarcobacter butzleri]